VTVIDACFEWLSDGGLRRIAAGAVNLFALILLGLIPIGILVGWTVFWLWVSGWDDQSDVFFFGLISPLILGLVAMIGLLMRSTWRESRSER
jgi:hypothetical protein